MDRKLSFVSLFMVLTVISGLTSFAAAQPSDAILKVRQRFLDADINTLTFHNIDEIFETRNHITPGVI